MGDYFRFKIGSDSVFEISGLNRFSIPRDKNFNVDELPAQSDKNIVNTRIAVIEHPVFVSGESIQHFRESDSIYLTSDAESLLRKEPGPQILTYPSDKDINILRQFIELYYLHCPPRYLGHNVRPLWAHDFLDRHIVFTGCLIKKGRSVPDSFLKTLLRSENPRKNDVYIGAVHESDVLETDKKRFSDALKNEVPSLSDKLWILADSYAGHDNQEMAVITAVASLEASINIYAQVCLETKLGNLKDDFIKKLGIYGLIEILPKLMFAKGSLPSDTTIALVKKAIEARNALMHGKHDRDGNPTFFNKGHMGEAIYACRDLKNFFEVQVSASKSKKRNH